MSKDEITPQNAKKRQITASEREILNSLFDHKRMMSQTIGECQGLLNDAMSLIVQLVGDSMINMQRMVDAQGAVNITLKKEKEAFEKELGVKKTECQASDVHIIKMREEIEKLKKSAKK